MKRREALQAIGAGFGTFPFSRPAPRRPRQIPGVDSKPETDQDVTDRLKGEPAARASVKTRRGAPRLFVNGRQLFPLMAVSTNLVETARGYRASGIRFLHPLMGLEDGWTGPGAYRWDDLLTYLLRLLRQVPDAYLLPRLHLNAPAWWKEKYPEDLIAYGLPVDSAAFRVPGRRIDGGFNWATIGDAWAASLASERWRSEMSGALRDFLRAVERSPLRSRVIGYHVAGGLNGEWHYQGSRFLPDYAPAMAKAAGPVPDAGARRTTTAGLLRDPEREADVIRFYERFHAVTADAALHFCRVVKEESRGRLLAGLFYGYLLENVMIQEAGHLAPDSVLASRDVDFVAAPYSYIHTTQTKTRPRWESDVFDEAGNWLGRARGIGGDGGLRVMAESWRRRGKLFMSEMDSSTYLEPHRSQEGGSGNDTVEGTLHILRRDLAQVVTTGIGGWLFDFGHLDPPYKARRGWYDDRPMIDEIRRWAGLGEARRDLDLSPVAEVAAVYDPRSFFATRHWTAEAPWDGYGVSIMDVFNHWFLAAQSRAIHRLGAPVDFLYAFDLRPEDAGRYRLIIAPNLFAMTPDDVRAWQRRLAASGTTVVWFYAPGYVAPERLDLAQMEALTGFRFQVKREAAPFLIAGRIGGKDGSWEREFGLRKAYTPRFAVDPAAAGVEIFGRWRDDGEPAFALKAMDGWTSVYVGTAPLPVEVLRRLAERAGVRLWSSKADVVRATQDMAMIIASDDGERTLRLHAPLAPAEGGGPAVEYRLSLKFGEVRAFRRR